MVKPTSNDPESIRARQHPVSPKTPSKEPTNKEKGTAEIGRKSFGSNVLNKLKLTRIKDPDRLKKAVPEHEATKGVSFLSRIISGWKWPSWNFSFKSTKLHAASTTAATSEQIQKGAVQWLVRNYIVDKLLNYLSEDSKNQYSKVSSETILTQEVERLRQDRREKWDDEHTFATFVAQQNADGTYTRQFLGFFSNLEDAKLANKMAEQVILAKGFSVADTGLSIVNYANKESLKEKRSERFDSNGISLKKKSVSSFKIFDLFQEMNILQAQAKESPKNRTLTQDDVRQHLLNLFNRNHPIEFPRFKKLLIELDITNQSDYQKNPPDIYDIEHFNSKVIKDHTPNYDAAHPYALFAEIDGQNVCLGYFSEENHAKWLSETLKAAIQMESSVHHQDKEIQKSYRDPFQLMMPSAAVQVLRVSSGQDQSTITQILQDRKEVWDEDHHFAAVIRKKKEDGEWERHCIGFFSSENLAVDAATLIAKNLSSTDKNVYMEAIDPSDFSSSPGFSAAFDPIAEVVNNNV